MLGSLRVRLPALFLLGVAVTGIVAALIALRLFQDYTRDQSFNELRREAKGLAQLYAASALAAADEGERAPQFAAATLELTTGDRLFYTGTNLFPGQTSGLSRIPDGALPPAVRAADGPRSFEFTPPGEDRVFLAASQPVRLEQDAPAFGTLIVAKARTEVRDQWVPLVRRLALAFLGGVLIAGALSWYLSRRITGPVLALSDAADEIAAGNYAVAVPVGPGGDEISHLSQRFNEMAARLAESEGRERQFLMSVSHELRTPLTAIHGHVDAIRDGLVDDPELIRQSLDVVANEAHRLERLVGDVLDLAKLNADRFTVLTEEVDMGRLVEQAYSAFGEEARRREIEYRLAEDGSPPTILTDGDRVLQVITNLLANAFRWTPDGGRVEVALTAPNGTIAVDVADSGPGIAADDRELIFRPFVSDDAKGGTGLGLPIARELAVALGGRVELDSELGRGSRFRLVLPARAPTGAFP
ncbi:MAG TPA: HAMP domain-containing sensor histidine kinase [Gaiellaceae bacterium]|jgi:two-component system sensor histidine kinase BaeS